MLERAESRISNKSTPLFDTPQPDRNPAIINIREARQALAIDDFAASLQAIDAAERAGTS